MRHVHGVAEVKTVIVDCTDGTGIRKALLAMVVGDQVVMIENRGPQAPEWLKREVLARLKNAGVDQA